MKKTKIYKLAIQTWGVEKQLRKLQEEACELAVSVSHYLDERGKGEVSLHEEFIDVEILLEQIRPTLNQKMLSQHKSFKLKRLRKRVEDNMIK